MKLFRYEFGTNIKYFLHILLNPSLVSDYDEKEDEGEIVENNRSV